MDWDRRSVAGSPDAGKTEAVVPVRFSPTDRELAIPEGVRTLPRSMSASDPIRAPCEAPKAGPLREIAAVFLRLGSTAFGGPAAHIAMMEEELVRRRGWVSREEFLDLIGAANLIPGPNSTELALFLGQRRAGWPGLVVAGMAFILPAALITGVIAWSYVRWGALPALRGVFNAVQPVILVVILQALWGLGRSAMKSRLHWLIAAGSLAAIVGGAHELLLLAGAGLVVLAVEHFGTWNPAVPTTLAWIPGLGTTATTTMEAPTFPVTLTALFGFFLKTGSVLFGSGYVLLAFLRADLVDRWHWISDRQLLDAIAVGQFTPGPVFTTATFIGYLLAGPSGAMAATAGIFLPAFGFVAMGSWLLRVLRSSRPARSFLDGLNTASLALMAVVAVRMAVQVPVHWVSALTLGSAMLGSLVWKVPSAWLIGGAAMLGCLATRNGWW